MWTRPLLRLPFPDVRRAVNDRNAFRLTRVEKTNAFEIDEIQFLQVQYNWPFAALDFGFELTNVPKSKFAAEPNQRLIRSIRSVILISSRRSFQCKPETVCYQLPGLSLERNTVLIIQEFLFGQESIPTL